MNASQFVEFAVLALVVACLVSIVWNTLRLGISPMPTTSPVLRTVLASLPQGLQGQAHELGAGWGTLAWAISKHCPQLQVIAWEASPVPYLFCRLRLLVQPRSNLFVRFGDFHRAHLHQATLVVSYLWTGAMTMLAQKFSAELPTDAVVISHTFAWPGKEAEEVQIADDLYRTPVYRYKIKSASPTGA